jgi:branched-chain amino acid transport system ATP-binding protein
MTKPLLECDGLNAFYGDFQALFGVNISIAEGEVVAIVGANGAGKSTLLRALTGLQSTRGQHVHFRGTSIAGLPPEHIHRQGIALVPEGRRLFPSLTVEENLLIGAMAKRSGAWSLERIYEIFPDLKERRNNAGHALSGGQQQMVAIGRSLMSNPTLLCCDELSLGLSPKVVRDIYRCLPEIRASGISMIIVEQDVHQARAVADRLICIQEGQVTLEGDAKALSLEDISEAYFGVKSEAAA